ncbi:MAG: putative lipid II flippase FtsW [Alcanivorax sp.]|nr:putative lipid II flippase FtsW [Alcanivorax sp.]
MNAELSRAGLSRFALPLTPLRPSLARLDVPMLLAALGLALVGLVMVSSASMQIAETRLGAPFYFAVRHGIYLGMGIALGVAVYMMVSLEWLEKLRFLALPASVAVLLMLFIPGLGREVNGSLRWINLAGFTVQPSEIAKLGFVMYLAGYISVRKAELESTWKAFLMPLVVLGMIAVLLLMQPDFGAVMVLGVAAMGMLFLAGVPTRRFLLLALLLSGLAALIAFAQPYRVARLMSFMDPWADQFGSGYQLTQSLIAFGRGHWFGVGMGNSVQKLFYLPEAHTDFVYAVLAEELGLFGNLLLIAAFTLLISRIFLLGAKLAARGWHYHAQLVYGIALIFSTQVVINLGVNMGLLPTKGLTLPFVSYGGSSLLISAVMIALVLRAGTELKGYEARQRGRVNA